MSTEPTNDDGERILFPPPPKPRARRSEVKEPPADKPVDATTTKTEITRSLATIYNLLHKILHDDYRYAPSDFSEEADGLIDLMNQHAPLRIVMRVLTPVAAIGALIEKVQGTIERFRFRRKLNDQREEAIANNDTGPVNPEVTIIENTKPPTPGIDPRFFATRR